MNAVWNSYGQLCGCPEIFKKSCKFFCRELDIRVAQGVHTEMLYTCPVTQLIQVRIIAAVLCGHSGTEVDKDKVTHIHLCLFRCPPVNIGQHFVQFGGLFSVLPYLIQVPQDLIGSIR